MPPLGSLGGACYHDVRLLSSVTTHATNSRDPLAVPLPHDAAIYREEVLPALESSWEPRGFVPFFLRLAPG